MYVLAFVGFCCFLIALVCSLSAPKKPVKKSPSIVTISSDDEPHVSCILLPCVQLTPHSPAVDTRSPAKKDPLAAKTDQELDDMLWAEFGDSSLMLAPLSPVGAPPSDVYVLIALFILLIDSLFI